MLLKLLLAMLMALITAVMAQEEFENPASDRPHVPRPWNDDMAAVNLYDDNGCSGHEFTLNVIYGVEEGCWNVNNVQSLSAIEK